MIRFRRLTDHRKRLVQHHVRRQVRGNFGETEYCQFLKLTLAMNDLVSKHSAITDKYDPEKKVALVVDEWGAWYAPLHGSNPGFLVQQNSLRDAILAALNLNIFARHAERVAWPTSPR